MLQYRTNVFGLLFTTQGALPGMRRRRSGFIVNLSSVGGQDSHATGALYGATKFAVEGMSESLAQEVKEFGISVLIVEPGLFRTNFLHALQTPEKSLPEGYEGSLVENILLRFSSMIGKQPGDPDKAVNRMFEVITGEGNGGKLRGKVLRLPLGMDAIERIEHKTKRLLQDVAEARKLEEQESTTFSN
jgi:NAD(P)-dependent dehydrogenase (short-subunit alcohol dehydrogenase family)